MALWRASYVKDITLAEKGVWFEVQISKVEVLIISPENMPARPWAETIMTLSEGAKYIQLLKLLMLEGGG